MCREIMETFNCDLFEEVSCSSYGSSYGPPPAPCGAPARSHGRWKGGDEGDPLISIVI